MNSNWTGRTHNSMKAAFGPYTDHTLHPMNDPPSSGKAWFIYTVVVAILSFLIYMI